MSKENPAYSKELAGQSLKAGLVAAESYLTELIFRKRENHQISEEMHKYYLRKLTGFETYEQFEALAKQFNITNENFNRAVATRMERNERPKS